MATYLCSNSKAHKCERDRLFKNKKQRRLFDCLRDPVTDVFQCFNCQKEQDRRANYLSSEVEKVKRGSEQLRNEKEATEQQLRRELKTEREKGQQLRRELKTEREKGQQLRRELKTEREKGQQLRNAERDKAEKELKAEKKKAENFRLCAQTNQRYTDKLLPLLDDNEASIEILSRLLEDEKQKNKNLDEAIDLERKQFTAQLQLEQERQKTMEKEIEKLHEIALIEKTRANNEQTRADKEIKLLVEKNRMIERNADWYKKEAREAREAAKEARRDAKEARRDAKEAREAVREIKEVAQRVCDELERTRKELEESNKRALEYRMGVLRCADSYEHDVGYFPNHLQETVNNARQGFSSSGTTCM